MSEFKQGLTGADPNHLRGLRGPGGAEVCVTQSDESSREKTYRLALELIRDFPISAQDNLISASMRKIAELALPDLPRPKQGEGCI